MIIHKTYEFKDGHTLEIIQDEHPESPREWDNLGTMVCFHRRQNLGDEDHGIDQNEFGGWDEMEKWIRDEHPNCVVLPLYLFDHSGITMNTTGFSCSWDSGQIGFIFVSRETITEEFKGRRTDKQIEDYLRGEVETYDQFIRGDMYGFQLRGPNCDSCGGEGEVEESCWGFFGDDPTGNGIQDHLSQEYQKELAELV